MVEREPVRMQRLTLELNRSKLVRSIDVSLLADERMAAKPGLNTDLVAFSCLEADLEERRVPVSLDHLIMTDRVHTARVARMCLFLDQRLLIPDEAIAPRSGRWFGMAVHDRAVYTLDRVPLELALQPPGGHRLFGEDDQAGRIAIDAMHDEWPPLTVRTQMLGHLIVDGRRSAPAFERNGKEARRLVENDKHVVFVNNPQIAGSLGSSCAGAGAAGAIHPHADEIAGR